MKKKIEINVPPRERADRDDRYMGLAWMIAYSSKDPSTQVGGLAVTKDNRPLGWGYNGPPSSIDDEAFSWERPTKYDLIKHAEKNAIDHTEHRADLEGATLYTTARPCKGCMLEIIDAKIARVVFFDFRPKDDLDSSLHHHPDIERVQEMADMAGVELVEYEGNLNWMPDWIGFLKDKGVFDGKQ
jgi:deoxycytidylate deaminase